MKIEINWIIYTIIFLLILIFIGGKIFFKVYKNKDIGKKFFQESEKPFQKSAPNIYYDKQMLFRKYYGFFIGVHYVLVVLSISLTTITIYMVSDENLNFNLRMIVSVLAAISTTFQVILRFDKVAEGYIRAVRIMEQAILEYEQCEDADFDVLLEANRRAEEIIHNMYH